MLYFTFASAFITILIATSSVGRLINGFVKGSFPDMYGEVILLLIGLAVTFIFYKLHIKEKYNIQEFSMKKIEFERDYEKKMDQLSKREENVNKFYDSRVEEANLKYDEILKNAQEKCKKIEEDTEKKVINLEANINKLQEEYKILNNDYTYEISKFTIEDNITSEEYKSKYNLSILREKTLTKIGAALDTVYQSNNHSVKEINSDEKQLLRCFNSEIAAILTSITIKNIDSSKKKIHQNF